jgi:hypothetical protein
MPLACLPGQIRRKAYSATRSATGEKYRVASACVPDVGAPGKTPMSKRIAFSLDFSLEPYGYIHISGMKAEERREKLAAAIADIATKNKLPTHIAAVKVMRYVNLMMVLNRETNKTLSKLLEADRNWIGKTYLGNIYSNAPLSQR